MNNPYDMNAITRYNNGDIIRYHDSETAKRERHTGERFIRRLTKKQLTGMMLLDAVLPELDPQDPYSCPYNEIEGVGIITNSPWGYVTYDLEPEFDPRRKRRNA